MRTRTWSLPALAAAVALTGAVSACGADSEEAAAQERMCDATDRVNEALREFYRTEEQNESEELARARDELFDAMAEWSHASSEVAQAEGADGEDPVSNLNENLESIPDDASMTEVAEGMSSSAGSFLEDVKGALTDREC